MKNAVQNVPEQLIYEMVDGKPIYYKGYKEYLKGKKQLEELIGSSYLQSNYKVSVFINVQPE